MKPKPAPSLATCGLNFQTRRPPECRLLALRSGHLIVNRYVIQNDLLPSCSASVRVKPMSDRSRSLSPIIS